MYQFIIPYFIIINIVGFFAIYRDKQKAKKRQWRIKESTLLMIAILGGSIGTFLSMRIFHHKTKTVKFYIGVPIIILVQIFIIYKLISFYM